jgi:hypothetical protein
MLGSGSACSRRDSHSRKARLTCINDVGRACGHIQTVLDIGRFRRHEKSLRHRQKPKSRCSSASRNGQRGLPVHARQPHRCGSGGQFVTFTPEELKALDVESSKVIDLEKFVPRSDLDPVYFDSSYYLYPDGPIAVETLRVIGAAMAQAGVVGLGRLTLSPRERMVVVEPRGAGMAFFTLRAAKDVRAAQFGMAEGELDAEMVRDRQGDHRAADRDFRSDDVSRSLPGGPAAAYRG